MNSLNRDREEVNNLWQSGRNQTLESLLEELEEMRIRLNKKNILMYKVEIDNYNMAIDDVVRLIKLKLPNTQ